MKTTNIEIQNSSPSSLKMSDHVFGEICNLAMKQAGLLITAKKKALVQSRISRRLRATSIGDYETYIKSVTNNEIPGELSNMISALTTNVSSFFREPHHFDYLQRQIIPAIIEKLRKGDKVRIWSAGCSSGQEPYSIAMLLHSGIPEVGKYDIKVLATDIDSQILDAARSAEYDEETVKEIPKPYLRYVAKSQGTSGKASIQKEVKNLVYFRQLNLLDDWPMRMQFETVFCRNVVIYFDESTQSALWPRFRNSLVNNGTFFLGHSERIANPTSIGFEPQGVTQYQAI